VELVGHMIPGAIVISCTLSVGDEGKSNNNPLGPIVRLTIK